MNFDFTKYFTEYEKLTALADTTFARVKEQHAECYKCKVGCSDCCYALFDIGLIEALYINHHFNDRFKGEERKKIIEKANSADRAVYKLKKKSYKEIYENGKDEDEIIAKMSLERIRCPLLNKDDKCDLYENRPITCRVYGVPMSIGGMSRTCGKSGFEENKKYQNVKIGVFQEKLYTLSNMLTQDIKTKYADIAKILVPVSMALLTDYNDEFFGLKTDS